MVSEQIEIGGSVETADLKRALHLFAKVVREAPLIPILDNILFSFELDELHLTGSNLITTVFTSIQADGSSTVGKFLLPYRQIKALVSLSPAGKIAFRAVESEDVGTEVMVTTEYGEFKFSSLEKIGDYPALSWSPISHFNIGMDELREGMKLTRKTVSTDELRPPLTGIYFDTAEGCIKFISTDGHKLTKYETSEPAVESILPFILPANFADFVISNTALKQNAVSFGCLPGAKVVANFGSCVVLVRCIDEFFPNYKAAIPEAFEHAVQLDLAQIKTRIQLGLLFSNRATTQMAFVFSNGRLSLESEDFDYGMKSKQSLEMEQPVPELKIGFNVRFMSTILAPFSGKVTLLMSAPNKPAVFIPQAKFGKSVQLLLMPVMLMS
ncbi:DNA polymerase III subunit beta [Dyadobacter fermentans]|uniref:Beta sliding clamp n=1 Tax=Dyadobacter fermentans (strain ATCC 700827 / DSM 18053 / CIP 107007 / KCTC 52180 / NS114) TaxID=471854 RepID=C6VVF6_DYAFD|nr:DNA polymerase III subunit beta [Dyadobacter fermentans]ACT96686.1 DNA polymerase III, beta subunit [Dyadobacter fermentans DSM 18053]